MIKVLVGHVSAECLNENLIEQLEHRAHMFQLMSRLALAGYETMTVSDYDKSPGLYYYVVFDTEEEAVMFKLSQA